MTQLQQLQQQIATLQAQVAQLHQEETQQERNALLRSGFTLLTTIHDVVDNGVTDVNASVEVWSNSEVTFPETIREAERLEDQGLVELIWL